ncbi:hypothetical protein FHT78_000421 [Rhizobium sp. BK196]|uniref:hypothetical protein n=1 Tax=Rhizobium sp. BK196 TaxID=2587073 RepID=UPI00160A3A6A|nr:hypothetical protein [Rhizobium sp. BK196]MBB3308692.1 hypothetical protein [Rhizobium sp. BK196]
MKHCGKCNHGVHGNYRRLAGSLRLQSPVGGIAHGLLVSLAIWLLTVLAAFVGLAAVLFIKGSLPHPYVTNGEIIIKEMQNFFLALIASPFVVWFYRNRRRAKAAAPPADG